MAEVLLLLGDMLPLLDVVELGVNAEKDETISVSGLLAMYL